MFICNIAEYLNCKDSKEAWSENFKNVEDVDDICLLYLGCLAM